MEISLTAEQEAFLGRIAGHQGKPVGQRLTECAVSMLDQKTRFLAEVEESLAAAGRGEFIGEAEWTPGLPRCSASMTERGIVRSHSLLEAK